MGFAIFIGVVGWLIQLIVTGWLAGQKGRSVGSWVFFAFFIPWIALIAIAGAPPTTEQLRGIRGYH